MHRIASFSLCLFVSLGPGIATLADDAETEEWRTLAEASDFRDTPSYDETLDFIRQLSGKWPAIHLGFFGSSAQGRPLPVVIVSQEHAFSPEAAAATGKPIVMIQSGIHSGEIDGKDASLMILRDLALGRHRELLEKTILLIVPIYNVDGHERVSRYNRPNQNGPSSGMGFRTTADGHDLNRDHLKLVTLEARAMIGLFNRWQPHLHVDNHVTDGVNHDWVLTYSWADAPQASPSIAEWLDSHMPAVLEATQRAGHRVGPYVSLLDRNDPSKGLDSSVEQPRFATGYYPLRHRPSILVENHAYKPYEQRIRANVAFMLALLEETARDPQSLIRAVREAQQRTVALGRPDAEPSEVTVRFRNSETPGSIRVPFYDWHLQRSEVMGVPILQYREGQVRESEVPWVHAREIELTVGRPRGYLVLPGWPVVERRLIDHGLRLERLDAEQELEVETIRISNPKPSQPSGNSYQGLTPITVDVERRTEMRRVPEGTIWIAADQPDFEVAVQLLEPEAPDSLVSWGLLSGVLEWKEYIEPRVLESVARDLLRDEKLAAEWRAALEDEVFASDPSARYAWWYERTPYWDETVGLMPVMRLMTSPSF